MRSAARFLLVAASLTLLGQTRADDWPGDAAPAPAVEADCGRVYGRLEYVLWWLREGHVPPLLTTSSFASGGRLGEPDTQVLYGGDLETRHGDRFNGLRFALGYWLDADHDVGIEGEAFFLERDSTYFKAISDGSVLLARPFYDAVTGAPMSEIIAGPVPGGLRNGQFVGYSRVELFGEQLNFVVPVGVADGLSVDLLAGARFLQMRDRLDLTSTGFQLPDQTTLFGLTDHFRVDDRFYGGQVGVRGAYTAGRWSLGVRGEAALGGTEQVVRTWGDRTFQTPTVRTVQPFGLAVLPNNTGRFSQGNLDEVYEVGAEVGYRLTRHWRAFAGYTFLYWNNPIRAGDQVDQVVNTSQLNAAGGPLVGPARPAVPFREEAFWAQGLNVGMEFRW
jgi:hypothetical protein